MSLSCLGEQQHSWNLNDASGLRVLSICHGMKTRVERQLAGWGDVSACHY